MNPHETGQQAVQRFIDAAARLPQDIAERSAAQRALRDSILSALPFLAAWPNTRLFLVGQSDGHAVRLMVWGTGQLDIEIRRHQHAPPVTTPDDEVLLNAARRDGTTCPICGWYTNPHGCCNPRCMDYSGVPF